MKWNWLFKKLTGNNWFGRKFVYWYEQQRERKRKKKGDDFKLRDKEGMYFSLSGNCYLRVSKNSHMVNKPHVCGFAFGVNWSEEPYSWSVLGRTEARRLAEYLHQACDEAGESEMSELRRRFPEVFGEGQLLI